MSYAIGETICKYRQAKQMTQEEFASRLGVTPQAVSKWERGNGQPDISLVEGICRILGISADILLRIENKVVESGNPIEDAEVKANLVVEPIVIEFSDSLIQIFCDGMNTTIVEDTRLRLAREAGLLLPIIRFRDNQDLGEDEYQILVYDEAVIKNKITSKKK